MTKEEKEDFGLLLLMKQNDPKDEICEDEIFSILQS